MAKKTVQPVRANIPATVAAVQRIWAIVAAMRAAGQVDAASIMALMSAVFELIIALRAPSASLTTAQVTRAATKAGLPKPERGAAKAWLEQQG